MLIKIKAGLLSLTALIFAVCLVACKESKVPIEVAIYSAEYGQRLEITAIEDKVTVTNNVKINRGNCGAVRLYNGRMLTLITNNSINPKKYHLVFGQKLSAPIYNGCTVKEVDIEAEEEHYTFTFDPA